MCPFRAACKTVRLVENPAKPSPFPKNWGKAPCAFAGCRGGASPCKAQRRHRGARSAMASAIRVLCKICGARGNQRSTLLAILRRSRPFLLRSTFFIFKIGVKRPALSRGAGAAQAPAVAWGRWWLGPLPFCPHKRCLCFTPLHVCA